MVTPQNKVICCDAGAMKCLTELFQPSSETEAAFTPLAARLIQLLEGIPTDSWYCCPPLRLQANPHAHMGWQGLAENYHHPIIPTSLPPIPSGYFREMIRRDIRRAREMYRGEQLSRELARIQQRLDSMELLSLDIVVNLLLSYRDVQVRGFKHPGEVPGTTSASRWGGLLHSLPLLGGACNSQSLSGAGRASLRGVGDRQPGGPRLSPTAIPAGLRCHHFTGGEPPGAADLRRGRAAQRPFPLRLRPQPVSGARGGGHT